MRFLAALVYIIFLSCISVQNTIAQNQFSFKSLNNNDGLSSNKVNCIIEDKTGFMWFGTEEGLCQYNGYDFEIFRHAPDDPHSISNNIITAIVEEKKTGNLWIGTQNGLNYLDRTTNKFIHYFSLNDKKKLSNQIIYSLCLDSQNNLWIGTNKGVNCYRNNKTLKSYINDKNAANSLSNNLVSSIVEDKNGNIWMGTKAGLDVYNKSSDDFTHFTNNSDIKDVTTMIVSIRNELWVGTNRDGLFRVIIEGGDKKCFHYTMESGHVINNRVFGIAEDETGSIYITNRDGGLTIMNTKSKTIRKYVPDMHNPHSLNSKALLSIAISSGGIIWIGTFNSGVNFIDTKRKQFQHFKVNFKDDGLFNNNIRSMFQDSEGNVWIGTKEEGGLSKFNRDKGTFVHYKPNKNDPHSLNYDYVFSINEIDSKRLLVGTFRNGLNVLDKSTGLFTHYKHNPKDSTTLSNNRVYAIHKDRNNKIWIGTSNNSRVMGLINIFDPLNKKFRTIPDIIQARCFLDGEKDHLWIGTYSNGLYSYNYKNKTFVNFRYNSKDKSSISNNNITAIKRDKKSRLWIGTLDGLNLLSVDTGKFTKYTVKNGLPNNRILGIEIDDNNNLWISTANGLSKFNPETQSFRNYNVKDGLQGNEFETYVSLKTANGEIYFGGQNGFNVFHPDKIKDNINPPKVVVSGLKIFNKNVPIGTKESPLSTHISKTKKLVLNHKQSVITFEFVALNFSSPEKNQYAYRLENLEKEWNYCGSKRSATYTSLPPGTYNFHVKASNNDNYWNEEGKTIEVVILPPYWQTWWFRIIVAVVFIGSVILFFIVRLQKIREQKITLEKLVDERTSQLKNTNSMLEEKQEEILQQSEEIQVKSEELLQSNSQLEQQNKKIKMQSEELKQSNSQLQEQKKEIEKVYKNMMVLSEFGQKLTASLDISKISEMLNNYLSSIMDISAFGIGLYNEKKNEIIFDNFISENEKLPAFTRDVDSNKSLTSWSFRSQKAVYINDWENEYKNYVDQIPIYSTTFPPLSNIHLPLTFENRKIGVITVSSFKKNAYSRNNFTNLRTVASYLAIALENARAYKTIDEKSSSIESSIKYAETIQKTILPPANFLNGIFENFILYKPKDIVSGDFYWMHQVEKEQLSEGVLSTVFVAPLIVPDTEYQVLLCR